MALASWVGSTHLQPSLAHDLARTAPRLLACLSEAFIPLRSPPQPTPPTTTLTCPLLSLAPRRFLRFVTGSPRLPPGGLAALQPRLTVVRKLSHAASGGLEGTSVPLGSSSLQAGSASLGTSAGTGRHPADADLPSGEHVCSVCVCCVCSVCW